MIQEGLGQTAVWWAAYLHQVQVGVGAEELIIDLPLLSLMQSCP
jgi:hypothetical protein